MSQNTLSAYHNFFGLPLAGRLSGLLAILCLLCACVPTGSAPVTMRSSASSVPVTPGSPTQAEQDGSGPDAPTLQALPTATVEVGLCSLGELSASMEWQKSRGTLAARLVLANFGPQACTVQGAPQIELVNENGWKLPVDQIQNSAGQETARVVLDPASDYTTEARFVWRNWCTPASKENLHLEVVLPGYPGKLNVPVQDPNGHYLPDTPHCDDPSAPSTLTIEAFK